MVYRVLFGEEYLTDEGKAYLEANDCELSLEYIHFYDEDQVIAAMKGADFVLMVTEPTPFGLDDLKLAVEAVKLLEIPRGLVINRSDIGNDGVRTYAKKENLPILMEIPFDRRIAEVYSRGKLIVEEMPEWEERFRKLYLHIQEIVG